MTDRYNALIVVLEENIRSDDAENLLTAIRQLRGVLSVSGNVASPNDYVAKELARSTLGKKIIDVIYPPKDQ